MSMNNAELVDVVRDSLTKVFLSLGNGLCVANPTIDDSDEGRVIVSYPRLGQYIIVGAKVVVRTLNGPKAVPGFVVGYVKTVPQGPDGPDDCEDVDTLRTQSLRDAITEFASLFVKNIVDGLFN